ncbi:MAG TPA: hypothetical protein DD429_06995 [Clostridiaceae bacterium]|nr:hypothetical protein [Clostridiaceae bacterium]
MERQGKGTGGLTMDDDRFARECIKYFKSSPGFKRLFEGMRDKYRSLGYIGGTVVLKNPTPLEREALSGLLKRDCYSSKSISVKAESVLKAIDGTRFQYVDFDQVLKGYFNGKLISKKDERVFYEQEKDSFFAKLLCGFEDTKGGRWLRDILESHKNAYKIIIQRYDRDREKLTDDLIYTIKGINELSFSEKKTVRFALFSSKITKNPHFFDMDNECGKLLLQAASYILDTPCPQNAEGRAELLYRAGIINDQISNYTMCCNVEAYINGEVHSGWHGFFERGEPLLVSLWNLAEVDTIKCRNNIVFIFENPTVFSQVLSETSHKRPSLICTYGEVRLASLVLLDKLVDNVDKIYYSGDLDPEGILIADKLKQRYKEKLILWHYEPEDYNSIRSKDIIDGHRLKKLERLKSIELLPVADAILKHRCPAYQELLTNKYIQDVLNI